MNREILLDNIKQFYKDTHPEKTFIPGETYIPVTAKVVDEDDLVSLVDSCLDMWLTSGRFSNEFEKTLPYLFGRKTPALLVNSGSSANLLAVSSLGSPALLNRDLKPLKKGDEVITVAAGFPTTVNPIFQNGWVPVFVDVDWKTLDALPEKVLSAVSSKTRAIVLAHTLGNPYRADKLAAFCEKEGIFLVEDCCDALGARIQQEDNTWASVGSFGAYATLSFYPAHHITTGEGGAVIAKQLFYRRIAESIRDWGRDCWCEPGKDNTCGKRFGWQLGELPEGYDHKYTYSHVGYNLKATDMQAALGLSQLRKVHHFIESRKQNWKWLYEAVTHSPKLAGKLIPIEPTPGTDPSWFGFAMHCGEGIAREKILKYLEGHKVGTRLLFGGNLLRQPAYLGLEYKVSGSLDATEKIMKDTFWIGVHPALDEKRRVYMIEQLEKSIQDL
jgi:CDP-6-deoxy-D-xylo-4-hexulose-3-dehydrase